LQGINVRNFLLRILITVSVIRTFSKVRHPNDKHYHTNSYEEFPHKTTCTALDSLIGKLPIRIPGNELIEAASSKEKGSILNSLFVRKGWEDFSNEKSSPCDPTEVAIEISG
jgi:hypothetical protein